MALRLLVQSHDDLFVDKRFDGPRAYFTSLGFLQRHGLESLEVEEGQVTSRFFNWLAFDFVIMISVDLVVVIHLVVAAGSQQGMVPLTALVSLLKVNRARSILLLEQQLDWEQSHDIVRLVAAVASVQSVEEPTFLLALTQALGRLNLNSVK